MVEESKVTLIVMLCKLVELGKVGLACPWWPQLGLRFRYSLHLKTLLIPLHRRLKRGSRCAF